MRFSRYSRRNPVSASSREMPKVVWVRSLVPKEKNCALRAISPAVRAARGISIIVPNWYFTRTPCSFITARASSSRIASSTISSLLCAMSGIMIFGCTLMPSRLHRQAASMMARTCMRTSCGRWMPRRTPRRPEHRVRLAHRAHGLEQPLLLRERAGESQRVLPVGASRRASRAASRRAPARRSSAGTRAAAGR